jgi:hypothetical protein
MAMVAPRGGNWREQGNALVEHGLNSFKGLVPINVRSLSGLSRRDEGCLWQDLLPGQFR